MRQVPDFALDFVAKHEGLVLKAYPDPGSGGDPWTIGYGHTGPEVKPGLVITKPKAREYLRTDLEHAARRLAGKVKPEIIDSLSQSQYVALLSFVFNLGAGNWTIWKKLNNREFDRVPLEMMKFVNAAGRRMQGLVNRRADEVKLWGEGDPQTVEENPPSSVTRQVGVTPPTPVEKPINTSKTFWTGAALTVTGAAEGARQAQAIVAPQMMNSDLLARLGSVLAVIIVAAGIAVMVFKWLETRDHRR